MTDGATTGESLANVQQAETPQPDPAADYTTNEEVMKEDAAIPSSEKRERPWNNEPLPVRVLRKDAMTPGNALRGIKGREYVVAPDKSLRRVDKVKKAKRNLKAKKF